MLTPSPNGARWPEPQPLANPGRFILAVAIVALRRRPLLVASVLSLLFIVGTLLALVLALTIGLFGIGPYPRIVDTGWSIKRRAAA